MSWLSQAFGGDLGGAWNRFTDAARHSVSAPWDLASGKMPRTWRNFADPEQRGMASSDPGERAVGTAVGAAFGAWGLGAMMGGGAAAGEAGMGAGEGTYYGGEYYEGVEGAGAATGEVGASGSTYYGGAMGESGAAAPSAYGLEGANTAAPTYGLEGGASSQGASGAYGVDLSSGSGGGFWSNLFGGGGGAGGGSSWSNAFGMANAAYGLYSGYEQMEYAKEQRKRQERIQSQIQGLMADPSALTNTSGYKAGIAQAEKGLMRTAAARGMTGSGAEAAGLSRLDQSYQSDAVNTRINQLIASGGAPIPEGYGSSTFSGAGRDMASYLKMLGY